MTDDAYMDDNLSRNMYVFNNMRFIERPTQRQIAALHSNTLMKVGKLYIGPVLKTAKLTCTWTSNDVRDFIDHNTPLRLRTLVVRNVDLECDAVESLSNYLNKSTALKELQIVGCNLRSKTIEKLTDAVKRSTLLETLILSDNCIGPRGAKALAQATVASESLRKLSLAYNDLKDCYAIKYNVNRNDLSGILWASQKLITLQSPKHLDVEWLRTFAFATSLQELSLENAGFNNLDDAHSLAFVIANSTSLRSLNLINDWPTEDILFGPLYDGVRMSTSLKKLKITFSASFGLRGDVSKHRLDALRRELRNNASEKLRRNKRERLRKWRSIARLLCE
jgi:hypothetical protein